MLAAARGLWPVWPQARLIAVGSSIRSSSFRHSFRAEINQGGILVTVEQTLFLAQAEPEREAEATSSIKGKDEVPYQKESGVTK